MSFKYDKDNLYTKNLMLLNNKDIALSSFTEIEDKENDFYTNRVQLLKRPHKTYKRSNPSYYSELDIDFNALLNAYKTTDPRETFYQLGFGMSYAEKRAESVPTSVND